MRSANLGFVAAPQNIFSKLNYEIVREIAEGGMGTVYEAEQFGIDKFSKTVAIKLIREEFNQIPEFCKNFVGEARLVANLIHTNIIQIYHLGKMDNRYFMVMEYVDGFNLEDFIVRHLETNQEIPIDLAVFIVSRICRGLAYAHQKRNRKGRLLGIVHRDVNPKNILLTMQGDVKLTDFGIAKAFGLMYNKEGEVIAGKDEYLSPEQARREITDARADLFSCGVVLSELLLGQNIFEGKTGEETRENIQTRSLPDFSKLRLGLDGRLNKILHMSLERNREKRYQNAADMLVALEMFLYSDRYGPTNEKFATYMQDLYSKDGSRAYERWVSTHGADLVAV